jgi:amino acid adenylation domain-containing protein
MIDLAGAVDVSGGRSLRSGFLRSAAATPQATALVVQDVAFSFGELDAAARVWARAILDVSDRPPQRVGVFGYRSHAAYAGVLASLYAGATFVPLNPTFPCARTRAMIALADLDAIVVDAAAAAQLVEVLAGLDRCPPIVAPHADAIATPGVTAITAADLAAREPLRDLPATTPDDVAYLLFTSGSTGQPKGVPVTHGNVLHFVDFVVDRYRITAADRFSQTFDQTFDLSIFDLFAAWECGACVCAMQPIDLIAPGRFVQRHGVTVWFSVPSIPALMRRKNLLKPNVFPTLRWSLFCGEPLPRASAEAWQAAAPHSVVENLYGPTELTVACLVHRWDAACSPALCVNGITPIGRPFSGLTAAVLDDELRPMADGDVGELCVSGPQTVPGYWRAPEKTAERFVWLAVKDVPRRFYRTGDRVKRLAGGDYVYLGRTDHQVKVRGYRVELSEIEDVLLRCDGVTQAVALGWPVVDGSAEGIVAFVCGGAVEPPRIADAAQRLLPDYMRPKQIMVVERMPLNSNGKIDRNQLKEQLAL